MSHSNIFLLRTVLILLCYTVNRKKNHFEVKVGQNSFQDRLAFTFLLAFNY